MLKITPELKAYMVKEFGLAADATDEACRKAIADAMLVGVKSGDGQTTKYLDASKLAELSPATKATEGEAKVQAMIDKSIAPLATGIGEIKGLLGQLGAKGGDGAAAGGQPEGTKAVNLGAGAGSPNPADAPNPARAYAAGAQAAASGAAAAANGGGNDQERLRIEFKTIADRFDDTRTSAVYTKSPNPVLQAIYGNARVNTGSGPGGRDLDMPTDRSKAIAGAWLKHMIEKRLRVSGGGNLPADMRMTPLDRRLVEFAAHECKFVGPIGYWEKSGNTEVYGADAWYEGEKIADELHRKAVLDDSTSGGLEAVPIEFDAAVILTPLLEGELFPLVSLTNVTRRRIEATKISNPTTSWGVAEGTAVSLFNTDSFISAFDTTIYPITGAIEVGLDFLADSPLAVGNIIVNRYGSRFRNEMDTAIANGNGTNRPEGLFVASGTTDVAATSAGSAPVIGDYEALMFGVAKEFRQEAGNRAIFLSTDTSYRRARGIPVDSSNDARRLFGLDDFQNYRIFGYRYAVNASAGNAKVGFFCMNRYRMYRRQGLEVRMIRDDWQLARENKEGILVRARFGGALELGAAGAYIDDMQS